VIRHTVRISELRLSRDHSDDEMPEYCTACNLVWLSPTVVLVSMLNGPLTRSMLREFIAFLVEQRIETIRADRAPGHMLPLFRWVDGNYQMDVLEAASYAER
jgi:hypothetical protein